MKKLLLAFCATFALSGTAQKTLSTDYAYTVSAPYKVVDGLKYYFSQDGQVMTIKFDGGDIYIQKFDAGTPAFISEKKYEDFFPKHFMIEAIEKINEKYYVFFSSWDGDNDKEQLFSQEVDFNKGEFVGTSKLLFKVNGKVAGSALFTGSWGMTFGVTDKFTILPTHDKKNFLVEYRKKPEVKNDKKSFDIIGLHGYDGNLNALFNKEVTMPYTERRMNNLDFQIDNKGNMYLLTKVFHDDSNDDKKRKKDEEANYHVELFTIKAGSDKINITKLENKDKFISGLWIFDGPNGDLIAGGYYNNGKGKDFTKACDGIITFKMSEDGSITNKAFYDIPVDLINEFESKKTQRENDRKEEKGEGAKFTDLRLKDMEIRPDGSVILVGEQTFTVVHYTSGGMNGMGGNTYYTYHYNDIFISKINADGQLGWMKKIPKQQTGTRGQGGMGYKFFSNDNNHFLVFLDNVKNIDLPLDKAPALHTDGKGGYLTAVKISDVDGSYKKGSILNAREMEDFKLYQIDMGRILKTSESTFVMEAYKKKKEDIMIKVTLK